MEEVATRAAQARRWDLSLVDMLMQDVDGSTADLLKEAGRMVQELAGEDRRNWETRAQNQAMRVMHVASEAYKSLSSRKWTLQDCREYEEELESELQAYCKIAGEVKLSEMSTKMRQMPNRGSRALTPRSTAPKSRWRVSFLRTSVT